MSDSGGNRPWLYDLVSDTTAQSEPLAVLLLVGITVTGGGLVVVFGGNAIQQTSESADVNQAEHAMTQLDSKSSLVAHGSSDSQRVDLGRHNGGTVEMDEDAGWMRVRIHNETDGSVEETVLNETLGAVVYERGRTKIAYQGGGVWRGQGDRSVMVSPPEVHYQGGTLTLPLVVVRGDSLSDGTVQVSQQGTTDGRYPNATHPNPLNNGTVNVTIESEYYRAWGQYFSDRTGGNVTYDHADDTVTIELITPFGEGFQNAAVTTQQAGITVNGNDPPPSPSETGVNYPLLDTRIEDEIANCESGGCNTSWSDINSAGTYYQDGDLSGDFDIDASSNVTIVVNGTFDAGNIDVLGTSNVTVLVREDFQVNGDVNAGSESGDAGRFSTVVHSDGTVQLNGNQLYVGLIYAPGSDANFNGNAELIGGIVSETLDVNGNPNDLQYDPAIDSIDLELTGDATTILYLHVSVTEVEVTGRA